MTDPRVEKAATFHNMPSHRWHDVADDIEWLEAAGLIVSMPPDALIEAGWRPHQHGEFWLCKNDHWETIGNPCVCYGGTQDLKWGERR